jgi:hypothetical protein
MLPLTLKPPSFNTLIVRERANITYLAYERKGKVTVYEETRQSMVEKG